MMIVKLLKSIKDALKGFWKRHKYCFAFGTICYLTFSLPAWCDFFLDKNFGTFFHIVDFFIGSFLEGVWRFVSNLDALF